MWYRLVGPPLPKLKRPLMIVALSTSMPQYRALYSQAREAAKYMLAKLKFKEVGVVYSSSLSPEVLVRDGGVCSLPTCRYYLHRGKRDVILLAGDTSPMDDQYQFAAEVLGFAAKAGVKELYSLGARWSENPSPENKEPELNGFATGRKGAARLSKAGVKLLEGEPAPFFASLVVAMGGERGIEGFKISVDHGEPSPHTRTVVKMLAAISKMTGLEIDLSDLKKELAVPRGPNQANRSPIYS